MYKRIIEFQSTRPIRGATRRSQHGHGGCSAFQSTRPIRGATGYKYLYRAMDIISIHAPHTGRDSKNA